MIPFVVRQHSAFAALAIAIANHFTISLNCQSHEKCHMKNIEAISSRESRFLCFSFSSLVACSFLYSEQQYSIY